MSEEECVVKEYTAKDMEMSMIAISKMSQKKRKHVTLTIQEKLDIIDQVEEGAISRQLIASKYGIGKSTVHDIHKRRDQIRMFASMCTPDDVGKKRRVDMKGNNSIIKQEVEHEDGIIDSIEEFEYQEMNEQDYEVVYETSMPNESIEANSFKKKRKSRTLTFREKYDVINQVENGAPVTYICESYGIGRTTVYDYLKRKQEIIDFVEKSNDGARRTFKKSKYPEIEEKILEWCEAHHAFTKQQFLGYTKVVIYDNPDGVIQPGGGICGSWSWAKRFFSRHPTLKQKLINEDGDPINPAELSLNKTEFMDENDENVGDNSGTSINTPDSSQKKMKFLSLDEQHAILNEIDQGTSIAVLAERFDVPKATIYDIYKKRFSLRDQKPTVANLNKKVSKTPRYPELEVELLQWCQKQTNYPLSHQMIAAKARSIFHELGMNGYFDPTVIWAKKFILQHPELYERQGIVEEARTEDDSYQLIEEVEVTDENQYEDNDEFYEEEEYLLDEIEDPNSESLVIETVNAHMACETPVEPEFKPPPPKRDDNCAEIPDTIALKSLKILIKYSEQRGHDEILSQLVDYHSLLESNISK